MSRFGSDLELHRRAAERPPRGVLLILFGFYVAQTTARGYRDGQTNKKARSEASKVGGKLRSRDDNLHGVGADPARASA